jgi:hypothetical protein
MIGYIPLRNPITKAVFGAFWAFVALVALVQDKPGIALVSVCLAVFVFWDASRQWNAAANQDAGPERRGGQ